MKNFDASTPQLKVLKEWLDGLSSLDTTKLEPHISKNFKIQLFPTTANHREPPEETVEEFAAKFGGIMNSMTKFELNVYEVIEAPGKVVLQARALCSTADGATHTYGSISTFTFAEEDGKLKILHCKNFSDSVQRSAFIAGTTNLKAAY